MLILNAAGAAFNAGAPAPAVNFYAHLERVLRRGMACDVDIIIACSGNLPHPTSVVVRLFAKFDWLAVEEIMRLCDDEVSSIIAFAPPGDFHNHNPASAGANHIAVMRFATDETLDNRRT